MARRLEVDGDPLDHPAGRRHFAGRFQGALGDDLGLTAPAAAAVCAGVSYREIDATNRTSVADFRSS